MFVHKIPMLLGQNDRGHIVVQQIHFGHHFDIAILCDNVDSVIFTDSYAFMYTCVV